MLCKINIINKLETSGKIDTELINKNIKYTI